LLAAAESAAKRADDLVAADRNVVIPTPTAARELGSAFLDGYRSVSDPNAQTALPTDGRLIRLAAAISKHAAVSGRAELHNKDIAPAAAIQTALTGLAQSESLSPSQIRSRVSARFPELDRVPAPPHLDTFLAQTTLNLEWDSASSTYRFRDAQPASATTMHTRSPTTIPPSAAAASTVACDDTDQRATLRRSLDEHGFVAIGVSVPPDRPGEHERVARELAGAYDGHLLDITTRLIDAMRKLASQQGISWELIRSADAAEAGTVDARGLRVVIDRVVPELWEDLRADVFDGDPRTHPLILTEVSPLARYGHLDVLAKLSDLSAPRRRPVWVILPQLRGQHGALVDRKPIQLGSPGGQFIVWRPAVDLVPARNDEGVV
jgi:hypothetical protein